MCALFHKQPSLIIRLTDELEQDMTVNKSAQSVTDKTFKLLNMLAFAVQDFASVRLVLQTKFFSAMTEQFLELTNAKTENSIFIQRSKQIKHYLNIYLQLAAYRPGQQWLGSQQQGCRLWQSLINLLVNDAGNLDDFIDISLLTIRFLKRMLFADRKLQLVFAEYVKQLLLGYSHSMINSFLHQLLIQILLDEQKIVVSFTSKSGSAAFKSSASCVLLPPQVKNSVGSSAVSQTTSASSNCTNSLLTHPKCKLGTCGFKPVEVSLSKTIQQVINENLEITLASSSSTFPSKSSTVRLCIRDPVTDNEKLIPNEYTLEMVYNMYLKRLEEASNVEVDDHDLILNVHLNADANFAHFETFICNTNEEDDENSNLLGSPLEAFVNCNGLIVLAERLPVLMPFIREPLLTITDKDRTTGGSDGKSNGAGGQSSQYQQQMPKISPDFVDYVIMNESDGGPFIDDMYNEMPIQTTTTTMNSLNGNKFLHISDYK
jgi:hypothetical protein